MSEIIEGIVSQRYGCFIPCTKEEGAAFTALCRKEDFAAAGSYLNDLWRQYHPGEDPPPDPLSEEANRPPAVPYTYTPEEQAAMDRLLARHRAADA